MNEHRLSGIYSCARPGHLKQREQYGLLDGVSSLLLLALVLFGRLLSLF